jgi:predicted nucleotidyltransferase
VDPRSTASLGDPAAGLERLEEATRSSFPYLEAARDRTAARIAKVSAALSERNPVPEVATCVFGSWARAELTDESDDDWAVLVNRAFALYEHCVLNEIVAAQAVLGADSRKPGAQGVFGGPIAVPDLVENIGLDADTNTNLTRRMLLLLESRELHGSVRADAVAVILERYLNESVKSARPPRFLLNDIVRYWRTICVDFEGKSGTDDPKWAERNAKLRTSRKLLFAGGLVPVLLCALYPAEEMPGFLTRWFDATPLDRLCTAFLYVGANDPGMRAIGAYDRWIGMMSDEGVRATLLGVTYEMRDDSPLFTEIREVGREFEAGLDSLLFSTPLARLTRSYAIF